MSWPALIALLAILFGFAGILGELIYRAQSQRRYLWVAISFGTLVFLPTCLALPPETWLRTLLWGTALVLIAAFSLRPDRLPSHLWSLQFAYTYLAGTMLLIMIWSLQNGLASPALTMCPFAGLAGALAWQRSREVSA